MHFKVAPDHGDSIAVLLEKLECDLQRAIGKAVALGWLAEETRPPAATRTEIGQQPPGAPTWSVRSGRAKNDADVQHREALPSKSNRLTTKTVLPDRAGKTPPLQTRRDRGKPTALPHVRGEVSDVNPWAS